MNKKPKVPSSRIPTIGEKKEKWEEAIAQLVQYLDPLFKNMGEALDGLEQRLSVVEAVNKILPDKIEVIIKQEKK